jgi:glycosyltransferase involved in cell wall biosynthesis
MRVAIVHYWLLGMRGAEKVIEALCELMPDADIFTLFYDPERVSPLIRSKNVRASFLNPLQRHYRALLPLMPIALESLDLRGYDLVLSSESGPAKGVLASAQARHVCYCHTPMRYLWELYPAYLHDFTTNRLQRALMAPLANYLRLWDYASAARVDDFVANSENVRQRVRRAYRRDSLIIHPPVSIDEFRWGPAEDYHLIVSEFVAYKQLDYAVRLFARTGRRLKLVGDGPDFRRLRQLAGPSIEFCGRMPQNQLVDLYSRCQGFLSPGEEDFGIAMVEALASGKPVIAFGRGGAREIVFPGCGVLYPRATEESLEAALTGHDQYLPPEEIQASAARFSTHRFKQRIAEVLGITSPPESPGSAGSTSSGTSS